MASVCTSARAARSRSSVPGTACSSSPPTTTGMARSRTGSRSTSPCSRTTTPAARSPGAATSPARSTARPRRVTADARCRFPVPGAGECGCRVSRCAPASGLRTSRRRHGGSPSRCCRPRALAGHAARLPRPVGRLRWRSGMAGWGHPRSGWPRRAMRWGVVGAETPAMTIDNGGRRGSGMWACMEAWIYDPFLALAERRGMASRRRAVLALARGRVLELGAGTGLNLAHYPAGMGELVLTEPDPAMCARLARRVARSGRDATVVAAGAGWSAAVRRARARERSAAGALAGPARATVAGARRGPSLQPGDAGAARARAAACRARCVRPVERHAGAGAPARRWPRRCDGAAVMIPAGGLAVVLSGGGERAIAWEVGALAGLGRRRRGSPRRAGDRWHVSGGDGRGPARRQRRRARDRHHAGPADPPSGGPERLWLAALREEAATLEATGHRVTVVHASPPELVAMGPDPLGAATGHLAVAAGRDRGRALALQIRPSRAA
jgi:SAM-dependent methyltransferase